MVTLIVMMTNRSREAILRLNLKWLNSQARKYISFHLDCVKGEQNCETAEDSSKKIKESLVKIEK